MKYKPASIALKDVDVDDTGLRITTRSSVEDILPSIIDQGIINPPILLIKNGSYSIVTGFRRMFACMHLNIKAVDARVIRPDKMSPLEIAKIAIGDNTMQRTLNLVEETNALNLLSAYVEDDKTFAMTARSLGLPDNVTLTRKIKRLSNLPESTLSSVAGGRISLAIALELCTIEKEAAGRAVALFETLKTGYNKQREILLNLVEIAKREDITVTDIFNDTAFNSIINNPDIESAVKSQSVRTYLKERRFPEISKAEKTYNARMKKLTLNANMKLLPPRSFEGEEFELSFRFKDLTDLKYHRDELNRLIGHPEMADILLKH